MIRFSAQRLHGIEGPCRILIVDDSLDEGFQTERALRAALGTSVVISHASTLARTVERLSQSTVDVVVFEVLLHEVSETTSLLRIRAIAPMVPVVAYTRYSSQTLALALLQEGAQECLLKGETSGDQLAKALYFSMVRHRRLSQLESAHIAAAHRATHDPLTGLANRELFLEQFDRALALGARHNRNTGLLFVDLDGFKEINDHYGHASGDTILRAVSSRLQDCVRRSDSVARLGGDEFVVLLRDVTGRRAVTHVRDAILASIGHPIDAGHGHSLSVEASVGCAMSPTDGSTAQTLLDAADADMYQNKFQRRQERVGTPAQGTPVFAETTRTPRWSATVALRPSAIGDTG